MINARGSGEMVSKVSNVILAVIGIVIVVGLYFALTNFQTSQEEKNAGVLLESIFAKVNALEDGESNEFIFQGVEGWYLVGFNVDNSDRPDRCFLNNCLCVCNGGTDKESCDEAGVCKDIDKNVDVYSDISFVYFDTPDVVRDSGVNFVARYSCIPFIEEEPLSTLRINELDDFIVIFRDYGIFDESEGKLSKEVKSKATEISGTLGRACFRESCIGDGC